MGITRRSSRFAICRRSGIRRKDPDTIWINVTAPEDEDREIELREFGAEKLRDILLDYGYHMLLMPTQKETA